MAEVQLDVFFGPGKIFDQRKLRHRITYKKLEHFAMENKKSVTISRRLMDCLLSAEKIRRNKNGLWVADAVKLTPGDFYRIDNMGKKNLTFLKDYLEHVFGLEPKT
jgi:hypothetical protein